MPTNLPTRAQAVVLRRPDPTGRQGNLWLVVALCLLVAGLTHLVDRYGVAGTLRHMGRTVEDGAAIIASVPVPFG